MDDTELPRALSLLHEAGLHEAQKMLARAWAQERFSKRKRRGVVTVPVKLQGKYAAKLPATVLLSAEPVSPPGSRKSREATGPSRDDPAGASRECYDNRP
jgi:hypothetical protein